MQTSYSIDSIPMVIGQIADTTNKQIDSFQLVNIDNETRSYARFGDIVVRAPQGANSTAQVVVRANAVGVQTAALMIGIVVRDPSYGAEVYKSKLAADVDNEIIYRDVMNVMRKGRIVVKVDNAAVENDVIPGAKAFPGQIGVTDPSIWNMTFFAAANNGSAAIGTFVSPLYKTTDFNGTAIKLAVVEINLSN